MKLGKQSVFYNAFFLCMSSIGLQLIGFVYRIGLSRFGGAEVMGMYQLIMPAYSVIMSFTMSGLTLAVSRLCPISGCWRQRRGKGSCSIFAISISLFVRLCRDSGLFVSGSDCRCCIR